MLIEVEDFLTILNYTCLFKLKVNYTCLFKLMAKNNNYQLSNTYKLINVIISQLYSDFQ